MARAGRVHRRSRIEGVEARLRPKMLPFRGRLGFQVVLHLVGDGWMDGHKRRLSLSRVVAKRITIHKVLEGIVVLVTMVIEVVVVVVVVVDAEFAARRRRRLIVVPRRFDKAFEIKDDFPAFAELVGELGGHLGGGGGAVEGPLVLGDRVELRFDFVELQRVLEQSVELGFEPIRGFAHGKRLLGSNGGNDDRRSSGQEEEEEEEDVEDGVGMKETHG